MARAGGGSAAPTDPRLAISASGNTSGTLTLIGTGTAVFAGGPNITLSQQGSTITISGAAGGASAGVAAISASNTAYTSGTIVLSGSNAATVRSTTGQALIVDVPVQTTQTQNLHNVTLSGNTDGALAQISSGTMTLAGGANITLSQAGNAVTIVGGAGGAETQTAISGIAGSNTTYTSGTVVFTGSNAVTVRSTTGQAIVIDAPTQTTQTQGILSLGVSTGGNTAGNTTVNTGSRMVFVGSGALTLSQTTGAGASTITMSVPAGASATGNLGALAASNTTYTSGTVTITGVGGGITVSSNTGQRIDLSVAAQTVQTQGVLSAGVSNVGNTAGNTTVNTGSRMVLAGAGIVTLSQATAAGATTISISATESVQTQGILSAGVSNVGNTAGNTTVNTGSRMVFVGAGAATLSQATAAGASTISISVPTQTAQTAISGIAASNTTYTSGTVSFTGVGGGVTVSSNTGQRVDISVAAPVAQTVQTQNVHNVTLSGNTAGAMAHISSGTMTLAGGNNITLSQNGNAVTISGAAGGGAGFSAGASNLGNTAGSTGVTGTRLVFVGSDNVTLSQSTDANGGTVSFIGQSPAGGAFSGGVSNLGNTAGSTGITGTRLVLVGSQGVSLSQSTDANGGTVSILPPAQATYSYYEPFAAQPQVLGQQGQASLAMQPFTAPNVAHDRIVIPFWITNSTNSTASITVSAWMGIYTKNVSTLSLSVSYSTSAAMTLSGNVNNSLYAGNRLVTFGATSTLTEGAYWAGIVSRTTSAGGNGTVSQFLRSQINTAFSGLFGVASNNSIQSFLGLGTYSATTSAMPGSIAFSQLTGTGSLGLRAPVFYFASGTA